MLQCGDWKPPGKTLTAGAFAVSIIDVPHRSTSWVVRKAIAIDQGAHGDLADIGLVSVNYTPQVEELITAAVACEGDQGTPRSPLKNASSERWLLVGKDLVGQAEDHH
jgi:hypothetical protein